MCGRSERKMMAGRPPKSRRDVANPSKLARKRDQYWLFILRRRIDGFPFAHARTYSSDGRKEDGQRRRSPSGRRRLCSAVNSSSRRSSSRAAAMRLRVSAPLIAARRLVDVPRATRGAVMGVPRPVQAVSDA